MEVSQWNPNSFCQMDKYFFFLAVPGVLSILINPVLTYFHCSTSIWNPYTKKNVMLAGNKLEVYSYAMPNGKIHFQINQQKT